jgi:hypothetical protein
MVDAGEMLMPRWCDSRESASAVSMLSLSGGSASWPLAWIIAVYGQKG